MMNYVMLKEVCAINMGQSPDSDSYNENGEGVPFFQGNADFGERYPCLLYTSKSCRGFGTYEINCGRSF